MDHQASIKEVKVDTPPTQGAANNPAAPRKTRIILKRSTTPSSPSPQVSSSLEQLSLESPEEPKKRRSPRSRANHTSATSPILFQPIPEPRKPQIKLKLTHKHYERDLAAERAEAAEQALRAQELPTATSVESINPINEARMKNHKSSPVAASSVPNKTRPSIKSKRRRESGDLAEEKPRKKVKRELSTPDDKTLDLDSGITQPAPAHIESKKKRLPLQARSHPQSQAQVVPCPDFSKAASSGLALTSDEDKSIPRCPENKATADGGMRRRSTRKRSLSRKAGEMALLCDDLDGANTDKQRSKTTDVKSSKPKKASNKTPAKAKAPKVRPAFQQGDEIVLNQIVTELTGLRRACQSGDLEGDKAAQILMNISAVKQH
ncbi:hypothetical protein LIA77_03039 [Sarocladium implicatum]|nr:hypothetical protein LIA77_03039 [Sarocladium implicatum]